MMKITTLSYQEQEDLKNELRADIEVKINDCKKLTKVGKTCKYTLSLTKRKERWLLKELDLRENLLLDLMEFKDWDLTKQFAVARSKVDKDHFKLFDLWHSLSCQVVIDNFALFCPKVQRKFFNKPKSASWRQL